MEKCKKRGGQQVHIENEQLLEISFVGGLSSKSAEKAAVASAVGGGDIQYRVVVKDGKKYLLRVKDQQNGGIPSTGSSVTSLVAQQGPPLVTQDKVDAGPVKKLKRSIKEPQISSSFNRILNEALTRAVADQAKEEVRERIEMHAALMKKRRQHVAEESNEQIDEDNETLEISLGKQIKSGAKDTAGLPGDAKKAKLEQERFASAGSITREGKENKFKSILKVDGMSNKRRKTVCWREGKDLEHVRIFKAGEPIRAYIPVQKSGDELYNLAVKLFGKNNHPKAQVAIEEWEEPNFAAGGDCRGWQS